MLDSGSTVEWSLPLMVGWLVVVLALSVIEVLRLTGSSGEKASPVAANVDRSLSK